MQIQTSMNAPRRWLYWLEEKAGFVLSFEKVAFILLLILYVLPVWTEKYILNTDGPAHTYTAKVLLDYFFGRNLPLYRQYFALDYYADPNWFSRFWLMLLQVFFSGRIAEKLLVSAYLLFFPVIFRKLVQLINPANSAMSFFVFPFLTTFVFNYGFYNYSFSLAFMFGFFLFWEKNEKNLDLKTVLIGMLICTVIYFTHLSGFVFTGLFTGILIISDGTFRFKEKAEKAGKLLAMNLPGLILAFVFIHQFLLNENPWVDSPQKLMSGFFKLEALQIYSYLEHRPAHVVAFLVLTLFGLSLLVKARKIKWDRGDGFLLCTLAAIAIYFIQPEKLTIGGFWTYRTVLIPYLFMIVWSASVKHYRMVILVFAAFGIFINIYVLSLRWPYYHRVSQAMEEYMSLNAKILPKSTLLPIEFNPKGNIPDGPEVCPEFFKFVHAADYACLDRDAVSFAHNNWMPLKWISNRNPFEKIGHIEDLPPPLNFAEYAKNSNGGRVDYVLTWCMDKNYWWTSEWKSVQNQLENNYTLIDSSPHNLTKLYRLNK